MKRRFAALMLTLLFGFAVTGCKSAVGNDTAITPTELTNSSVSTADTTEMDFTFTDRDLSAEADSAAEAVTLSDAGFTVTKSGTYQLTGSITDGCITIACKDTDKVQLIFDGVTVQNSSGPALLIESADKVFITLAAGSTNTLSDGSDYTVTVDDTAVDAALFSKSDLTLNGSGTLLVNGNYKHGIVSKDDLVITGGVYQIQAEKAGLVGKDCIKLAGADLTVTAGGDGLCSDNDEDGDRGYIYIESGTVNITAGTDAVQAETILKLAGGALTLTAGGGSKNASTDSLGNRNAGWGFGGNQKATETDTDSAKGLKAGSDILIDAAEITVDSADDCIHANGTVKITSGILNLSSGDDGIHADNDLGISGGTVEITKSYEGLEAHDITITGGKLAVTASDDGLNAAGGSDESALGGRPGQNSFVSDNGDTPNITIADGYLAVNASGDGVDSNGTITVTGGITLVSGPTDSGNGALDYETAASISGGIFIAAGSTGMAENFTAAENQGAMLVSTDSQSGGTSLAVCDADGTVLASFTPQKTYACAVISAPGIKSGETYTVVVGGNVANADKNGYATDSTVSGGSTAATVQMTDMLYGESMGGMGGM